MKTLNFKNIINLEIYDRFSFDDLFRWLLKNGYENKEAKDYILMNCRLSALVIQERIYNKYYLKISRKEILSKDLKKIYVKEYKKMLRMIAFRSLS